MSDIFERFLSLNNSDREEMEFLINLDNKTPEEAYKIVTNNSGDSDGVDTKNGD